MEYDKFKLKFFKTLLLHKKDFIVKSDRKEYHYIARLKFEDCKNNEGEIKMASEKNEKIAKANEDNKKLSATKEMQELYWLKQKYIYDENTRISVATEKGEKIGLQKGERKKQLEIAKKMLERNMKIEEIQEITGLTKEEIEELNNV